MAAKEVPNLGALEQYSKPLNWCPLPSKLKIKLARAGYVTVGDVADFKAAKLSQSIDVTEEEAVLILDVSQSKATLSKTEAERDVTPKCLSLKELLEKEKELGSIVTFCAKFDDMLGGGIPLGKITEICGSAGTGKTQLCMQLAVDVTFPGEFGGVAGHTLYIDTEGSMVVERLAQMARAAVKHITDVAENVYGDVAGMKEKASEYTFEHVMESIHCYRCTHYLDLLAVINLLPEVCTANPLVRLVVVDSIACPFRSTFSDMVLRNRLLNGVAQSLIKLAVERSLAVVLTNQMVTQFMKKGGVSSNHGHPPRLVPTLGESWGHACTNRVVLSHQKDTRGAFLFKSPCKKETCVPFTITESGFRDVTSEIEEPLFQDNMAEDEHMSKRPHLDDKA